MTPSATELSEAIYEAARSAFSELFNKNSGQFYYCALIITGHAHPPFISAWSIEALEHATPSGSERAEIKWSYADSPFCGYGEEYFAKVSELFSKRIEMSCELSEEKWKSEYDVRLAAMEAALIKLDAEEFFGSGDVRNIIVVNLEVTPPDGSNTERAKRLNPFKAIQHWLVEAAE